CFNKFITTNFKARELVPTSISRREENDISWFTQLPCFWYRSNCIFTFNYWNSSLIPRILHFIFTFTKNNHCLDMLLKVRNQPFKGITTIKATRQKNYWTIKALQGNFSSFNIS